MMPASRRETSTSGYAWYTDRGNRWEYVHSEGYVNFNISGTPTDTSVGSTVGVEQVDPPVGKTMSP